MICPLAHYYTTRLNPKEIKKNNAELIYIYYLINVRNCWRNPPTDGSIFYIHDGNFSGFPFSFVWQLS